MGECVNINTIISIPILVIIFIPLAIFLLALYSVCWVASRFDEFSPCEKESK